MFFDAEAVVIVIISCNKWFDVKSNDYTLFFYFMSIRFVIKPSYALKCYVLIIQLDEFLYDHHFDNKEQPSQILYIT